MTKHSPKVRIVCEYCKVAFECPQWAINSRNVRFCSTKCMGLAHRKSSPRPCMQCGKEFRPKPSDVQLGNGKYCSYTCSKLGQRKKVSCTCLQCGVEFFMWPSEINRGGGKYCSKRCSGIDRRGDKGYQWRGGHGNYRGKNWSTQRKLAFLRDGGKCQNCGKIPSKSARRNEVHHIIPYRLFNGDYIRANDLLNLITLCLSCHRKAERGYIPVPMRLL